MSVDEPYVYLSDLFFQMKVKEVYKGWKKAFHPDFTETKDTKAITSHFGPYWFSTYWWLEAGMQREYVQYMRATAFSR